MRIRSDRRVFPEPNTDEVPVPEEARKPDRFDEVAGTADIKWRTDELMVLLRGKR